MKKIIGYIMISSVFMLLFIITAALIGFLQALAIFGTATFITAYILIAIILINDGLTR